MAKNQNQNISPAWNPSGYYVFLQLGDLSPCCRLKRLALFIVIAFSSPLLADDRVASPEEGIHFNASALNLDSPGLEGQNVDLSVFSVPGGQAPGIYNVSIYCNDTFVEKRKVTFTAPDKKKGETGGLRPVLTSRQLFDMGVKTDTFSALDALTPEAAITDIGHYIPAATTKLNFYQMRLDISIPQFALNKLDKNYAPPSTWDDGMPALLMSYSMNGNQRRDNHGNDSQSQFLSLNSGVNLGGWRYRNFSTYTHDDEEGGRWNNSSSYLQHDIRTLRGRLTLGDTGTGNDVFDSFAFRGVQLASDSSMVPGRFNSFAPTIRGIASSHAQVTVRQNGNVIYQTYVPPGPFVLDDLSPSGSGGTMEVSIREENGQVRTFSQPYAALPNMMRDGGFKYELTTGKYRGDSHGNDEQKPFTLLTGTYGMPFNVTVYGGVIGAPDYQTASVGMGMGLGILGAVSVDVTHSRTTQDKAQSLSGESYRVRYAKALNDIGTNVSLAAYRYSSPGYRNFSDFSQHQSGPDTSFSRTAKHEVQLTLNQTLSDSGTLGVSLTQDDTWAGETRRNMNAVYSNKAWGASYTLTYSESLRHADSRETDRQIALSVQIPISQLLSGTWMSYGLTHDYGSSGTQQNLSFGGTALKNNRLSYNAQVGYAQEPSRNDTHNGGVGLSYRGAYGAVNAGYSTSTQSRQWTYGYQGGLLVHPYGLTFGQAFQDGAVLVRAPGASGVSVTGSSGVSTDWRGYAIVPNVSLYRVNEIDLATNTLGRNVDITGTSMKRVTPSKGAVVLADFDTRIGEKVLFTLKHGGKSVPFGAIVSIRGIQNTSIVADEGEAYLTGVPPAGVVQAQWGKETSQRCEADFSLPSVRAQTDEPALRQVPLECR